MREIKFRAWHNGSYWPIRCIDYLGDGRICNIRLAVQVDEDDWDFPANDPREVTLEQFTGLRDEYEREVYEGDIMKGNYHGGRIGVIQFARGIFGINWDYSANHDPEWSGGNMYGSWGHLHNMRPLDDDHIAHMIIIGNIHENPELLNG